MAARCEAAAVGMEEGGKDGVDETAEVGDEESSRRRILVALTRACIRGSWERRIGEGRSDCVRYPRHKN